MQARAGGSADGGDGGICPAAGGRGWGHEPGSGSVYHLFVRKVGICGSELARFLSLGIPVSTHVDKSDMQMVRTELLRTATVTDSGTGCTVST